MAEQTTERDQKLITFVKSRVEGSRVRLSSVHQRWKENWDCFISGSRFDSKEEWQSQFSIGEVSSAIRTGVSRIRNNFLRRPDWFEIEGRSEAAKSWAPLLDKAMRYHLDKANFRKGANTFLLTAALSMGVMRIGWKKFTVRNPKLVIEEADKETAKFNKAVAPNVDNPQSAASFPTDEQSILNNIEADVEAILKEMEGAPVAKKQTPKFTQKSCLELTPISPFDFFFDPEVNTPEESSWCAHEHYVHLWEIKKMGKNGIYKNTENLQVAKIPQEKLLNDQRYRNLTANLQGGQEGDLVKVTEYFGNTVFDNEEADTDQHIVIINDSTVVKDDTNAFWGDGYGKPFVVGIVHEIPFNPTGAAMADNGTQLQRILDSNYQLTVDQMRLGLIGLNVINRGKVVDPSTLMDGIQPGSYVEVLDEPDKVFKHYNLTSNIENTVFPMNQILVQGIQKATGVSPIIQGYGNLRSRTSAAEVNAQVSGSEGVLYTSAEDLEISWLIPLLQKVLARILQFGLNSNDEDFIATLDENEKALLNQVTGMERYNAAAQSYNFKINGFGNEGARLDELSRLNEALGLYNAQGPLSQIMNGPYLVKEWASRANFKDPSKIVVDNTEREEIFSENRLLMNNHYVSIGQNDNHQAHLASHQQAQLLAGGNTPEMAQHVNDHVMAMQEQQRLQQEAQALNEGPPSRTSTASELREDFN